MNPADAADVLAIAATYDRRTVGEVEARAWAKALDGLDPADCAEAVLNHYTRTTDWLMPAHVRDEVKRIRQARLAVAGNAEPAYDIDDVAGGLAAIRAQRKAIADGRIAPVPELTGSVPKRLEQLANQTAAAMRRRVLGASS